MPKALRPGTSRRGQDACRPSAAARGVEVAEREARAGMRASARTRSHSASGRRGVGAEAVRAGDLRRAVEPRRWRAPTASAGVRHAARRARRRVHHRVDDLAVAGAAAEHAAERVLDRRRGRARIAPQQVERGHQHARRADAALRRAMRQEGRAQLRRAAGRRASTVVIARALGLRGRAPGRRRPARHRAARCRRRNRRPRSRPWCRSGRAPRAACRTAARRARRRSRRGWPLSVKAIMPANPAAGRAAASARRRADRRRRRGCRRWATGREMRGVRDVGGVAQRRRRPARPPAPAGAARRRSRRRPRGAPR